MKKSIGYYIGNFLILISAGTLIYIYSPFLKVYFFPDKLHDFSRAKGYFIQIPKISAQGKIIENVDPWNEGEYRHALKEGIAEARGFGIPSEDKTIYLFAHSSDYPWNITKYNTAFFRLGELARGDKIKLYKNGKEYAYFVFDKREVWPNETQYLKLETNTSNQLILQTCTPVGTSLKRLLIFAKPKFP